jgi:FkbH-like protein
MLALPDPSELRKIRAAGQQLLLQAPAQQGVARVVCLGTFNLDWLPAFLAGALLKTGISVPLEQGEFGQVSNLLHDPNSLVYQQPVSSLVIVAAIGDLLQPIFNDPKQDSETLHSLAQECFEHFREGIAQFLGRVPQADCLVVLHPARFAPNPNVVNPLAAARGELAVRQFEKLFLQFVASEPRVHLVDWHSTVTRWGSHALHDARLWYLARMRLNERGVFALADTVAKTMAAIQGKVRKVAVFDLDNTLWGGVVGEIGWQGIELSNEGIGLAYRDVQRMARNWLAGGTIIALCSKNNPADAHGVFEQHPEMLLRREHIAAERINWQDKAANLRELAEELNVGLESMVFFDDNPAEREWVRQALPMVLVPEMPKDISDWPEFLQDLSCFQRWQITSEDAERTHNYRAERERQEYRKTAASFEEYLASLEQKITIERLQASSLARAAQLCQRTNQFNLTTQRYTPAELQALADDGAAIFLLSVADRFGNHGVTGLAILKSLGNQATIDTLLLSCRILGRGIEAAFLAWLAGQACAAGAHNLCGRYIATAKNAQVADFYTRQGFHAVSAEEFKLDLQLGLPQLPTYLEIRTKHESTSS